MGSGSRFQRVLLKLSGEALAGSDDYGIDPDILSDISDDIAEIHGMGIEIAIVIGAGNIFRGAMGTSLGIKRTTGDHMGMLATVMNSLALQNALHQRNLPAVAMSAIEMTAVAETYSIREASERISRNEIVIAAGGTGHPFFTTDTAAALRSIELECDVLLKATRVDGVFSADPEKDPQAQRFESIQFSEVLEKKLRVMDLTAVSLCMDNNMPIVVFDLFKKGSLKRIIEGESVGTLVT